MVRAFMYSTHVRTSAVCFVWHCCVPHASVHASCVACLDAEHRQGDEGAALQGSGGAARADVPQQPRDLHKAREARPSNATRLHL